MRIKVFIVFSLFLSLFSQFLMAQSNDEVNLFKLGEQYYQAKDFERSADIFSKLTTMNPNNGTYFDRYWRSLFESGKYEAAHSVIEQVVRLKKQELLLNEMAKISFILGKTDIAKQEWNELKEKYQGNASVVRLIGATMIQLKQYDWAIASYIENRTSDKPRQFAMDLANIFTLTNRPKEAAKEYLNLLLDNPNNDSYVEQRISQYFSDSLSSASIRQVFSESIPSLKLPMVVRQMALLSKNMNDYSSAFLFNVKFDHLSNNGGAATANFLMQNSKDMNLDSLQSYVNQFKIAFPLSSFYNLLDVRLIQAYIDKSDFTQSDFIWVESQTEKKATSSLQWAELYLKAVLKSQLDLISKQSKIQHVLKSQKGLNQNYWKWVLDCLNENYLEALGKLSAPSEKSKYPIEYINTSLAANIPIDSVRNQLFIYSSEFNNKNVSQFLYLLIQSVPVPNMDFSEYVSFAKGIIQEMLFQSNKSQSYFSLLVETAKDTSIKQLAEIQSVQTAVNKNDIDLLDSFYKKLVSQRLSSVGRDELLYVLGQYYFKNKQWTKSQFCFGQLIEKNISSPYTSLSRNYLNRLRNNQS